MSNAVGDAVLDFMRRRKTDTPEHSGSGAALSPEVLLKTRIYASKMPDVFLRVKIGWRDHLNADQTFHKIKAERLIEQAGRRVKGVTDRATAVAVLRGAY